MFRISTGSESRIAALERPFGICRIIRRDPNFRPANMRVHSRIILAVLRPRRETPRRFGPRNTQSRHANLAAGHMSVLQRELMT